MAVTRRSFAVALSATIAKPAGVQAGDLLIACVARFNSTTPPTLPAGWTNITSGQHSAFGASFRVCYRIAEAGDGANYTFTNAQEGCIVAYQAGTFDAANPTGPGSLNSSNASATITATGVTTEEDGALLCAYLTHGGNNPTSNHSFSIVINVAAFGTDSTFWEATQATAGASGNKTWTVSSTPWSAQLISINPAPPSAKPRFHAQIIG